MKEEDKTMKKTMSAVFAMMLCLAMLFVLAACGAKKESGAPAPSAEPEVKEEVIEEAAEEAEDPAEEAPVIGVGGWKATEDPAMTADLENVFHKAVEGLLGVNYEPIACLGTQLVSGTNYAFFCRAQAVAPNAEPYYAVVKVYEDLEGNAEILEIVSMTPYGEVNENAGTAEAMLGSWTVPEDDEAGFAAFEKAAEGLVGASHTPIRVLGTQLVSGNNYCLLCRSIGVYPGAEPYYTLITVYEKLSGEAEITDIVDLDASGLPVA